jgi:hypothetical protein
LEWTAAHCSALFGSPFHFELAMMYRTITQLQIDETLKGIPVSSAMDLN